MFIYKPQLQIMYHSLKFGPTSNGAAIIYVPNISSTIRKMIHFANRGKNTNFGKILLFYLPELLSLRRHLERRFSLVLYRLVMADNILSETICPFYFYDLFSIIFPQLKCISQKVSYLCSYIRKPILLGKKNWRNWILLFPTNVSLPFHSSSVTKNSEVWTIETYRKPASKLLSY